MSETKPLPEVCAFCLGPVADHRKEAGVAADGVVEIRIFCPGKIEATSVEVTFQR